MAKVQIKRSSTSGATPTTLSPGELAANVNDGRLWVGGDSGAPMEIGAKTPTGFFTVRRASTIHVAGAVNLNATSNVAVVASRQYFIPIIHQRELTISQLRCYVSTALSGALSLGIYDTAIAANGDMVPGNLIASGGGLDTSTADYKNAILTPNVTLSTNTLYWVSVIANSAVQLRHIAYSSCSAILGYQYMSQSITCLYADGSGSTLPETASASLFNFSGSIPVIGLIEA